MKRTLLVAFAAVFLFFGLTGFPPVVPVTPVLAQWGGDVVVLDGLQLPRRHQYEVYDLTTGSYGVVSLDTVPRQVRLGTWVFDRTANTWVSHPSVGQPNPQYVASGRDARREREQRGDVVVYDGLLLPRSHQYELYVPANGSYGSVTIDTVPGHVRQGGWIYDRTADAWVSHPSVGTPNPQYVASGRDSQYAPSGRDSRREALLGQLEVDFRADTDVLEVGRDEGRFEKIRVVVRGAPIELRDIKVTFADNSVFDVASRNRILQEDSVFEFDLPGHPQAIKSITFQYRSTNQREGKATVLVYGRH